MICLAPSSCSAEGSVNSVERCEMGCILNSLVRQLLDHQFNPGVQLIQFLEHRVLTLHQAIDELVPGFLIDNLSDDLQDAPLLVGLAAVCMNRNLPSTRS
jgi:hypothetical protein